MPDTPSPQSGAYNFYVAGIALSMLRIHMYVFYFRLVYSNVKRHEKRRGNPTQRNFGHRVVYAAVKPTCVGFMATLENSRRISPAAFRL